MKTVFLGACLSRGPYEMCSYHFFRIIECPIFSDEGAIQTICLRPHLSEFKAKSMDLGSRNRGPRTASERFQKIIREDMENNYRLEGVIGPHKDTDSEKNLKECGNDGERED